MTYRQAREIYKKRHDKIIKDGWIAEILRSYNKTTRKAPNRTNIPINPCPKKIQGKLKKILRELGMI